MITILCGLAAISALAAIAADWNEKRHRAFYVLKPLTTLLIAGIALCGAPGDFRMLLLAALLLSMCGDICLMFPGNGWFIGGLGSFLVAHLAGNLQLLWNTTQFNAYAHFLTVSMGPLTLLFEAGLLAIFALHILDALVLLKGNYAARPVGYHSKAWGKSKSKKSRKSWSSTLMMWSGVVILLTFGTGIGSALLMDGILVPNTELGHLELNGHDAETQAAASVRDEHDLSYKKWAKRVNDYMSHVERLFTPDLFVVGGGVSKDSDKWVPLLTLNTPVKPAELLNDAGIVGAAIAAAERLGE